MKDVEEDPLQTQPIQDNDSAIIRDARDELLELLSGIETSETGGGITTTEIVDMTGWSEKKARQKLKKLIDGGKIEHIPVMRRNIAGAVSRRPAYRVRKEGTNG